MSSDGVLMGGEAVVGRVGTAIREGVAPLARAVFMLPLWIGGTGFLVAGMVNALGYEMAAPGADLQDSYRFMLLSAACWSGRSILRRG